MAKAAIVVLADTETSGELGRVVNALTTAKELKQEGDDVKVVFDGAGTRWVPALSDPGHRYHDLFEAVRDRISGACAYCATAFGVRDEVESSGVELLADFDDHPSLRGYVAYGFQVITF
jgi:hypothetical protein